MLKSSKSVLFTMYTKQQGRGGRVVTNLITTLFSCFFMAKDSLKTAKAFVQSSG